MTKIRGGPAGPDPAEADGAYKNETDSDRASLWWSLGGRPGSVNGFTRSVVTGELALDFAPGFGLVPEGDGTKNRGYGVWSDVTTRVAFAPPSAQTRRDVVVVAFVDTEDAPVGSLGLATGGHLVAVSGTSGSSVEPTDAAVNAAINNGGGGWYRLLSVLIPAGATQIIAGNIADAPHALNRRRNTALTAGTGWSLGGADYLLNGIWAELTIFATKTGTVLNAGDNGNFTDQLVASNIPVAIRPDRTVYGEFQNNGAKIGGCRITTAGEVYLTDMYPGTSITVSGQITVRMLYGIPQG